MLQVISSYDELFVVGDMLAQAMDDEKLCEDVSAHNPKTSRRHGFEKFVDGQ